MWQRERACRGSLRQLVGASYWSRATVLSLGREDDLVARFSALCDQAASDLVHAQSVTAWLAVRLRAGVIVAGLFTLVAQIWTLPESVLVAAPGVGAPSVAVNSTAALNSTASPGPGPWTGPYSDKAEGVGGGAALGMSALLLCLIAAHLARAATAAVRARSHLAAMAEARDLVNVSIPSEIPFPHHLHLTGHDFHVLCSKIHNLDCTGW